MLWIQEASMTTVRVEQGIVAVGTANASGIVAIKGIPYAAAPLGDLRFAPPSPAAHWHGVRTSDRFGFNALQGQVFGDIDSGIDGVSEDCLFLNIWTDDDFERAHKRPVLFWIHGGGFVVGSGSEPRYDGSNLAARGLVVVTVNHRLNALGFLAHPALATEHPQGASGNYGMLDLVAALQWVKRNIATFGGDPGQVTIAGESAGSMACSLLMCSPLAKGLFEVVCCPRLLNP
jgi:para-nitrobenzyl esterase